MKKEIIGSLAFLLLAGSVPAAQGKTGGSGQGPGEAPPGETPVDPPDLGGL